jgi:hypothetical protein
MSNFTTVTPSGASHIKSSLVDLGLYVLTHDHSRLWVPAICTIIRERRWTHA